MSQIPDRPAGLLCLLALTGLCLATPVRAERADRDKPTQVEADKVNMDDKHRVHVFEGNVTITQGTRSLRAQKVVVSQDVEGYQRMVATTRAGDLVRYREKLEGRDDFLDAEAERIETDDRTERTELFNRAWVRRGKDELKGQYILLDNRTENSLVTSGAGGATASNRDSRVRAVIQPRSKDVQLPAATSKANTTPPKAPPLQVSPQIANPAQERKE